MGTPSLINHLAVSFLKLDINLPHEPAIPLREYLPKKNENTHAHKDLHVNVVHNSIKKLEEFKCPSISEWIHKIWYIHTKQYVTHQ